MKDHALRIAKLTAFAGGRHALDLEGQPLHSLQDFVEGRSPFVSIGLDARLGFAYGKAFVVSELNRRYGRFIELRYAVAPSQLNGKGLTRIEVCVRDRRAESDPVVNGIGTIYAFEQLT